MSTTLAEAATQQQPWPDRAGMPLFGLVLVLIWNLVRALRGKSTICSTTRPLIPRPVFVAGWAALTAWFLPHWLGKHPATLARRQAN